nr:hypothetical protein [uncultured Flavobacterium sp.]
MNSSRKLSYPYGAFPVKYPSFLAWYVPLMVRLEILSLSTSPAVR